MHAEVLSLAVLESIDSITASKKAAHCVTWLLRVHAEVTLLHESSGHDDAVLSLDLCEAGTTPEAVATEDKSGRAEYHRRWILSVGADRVVKAWSLDLKRLGQLTSVSYGEQQANSLSNGLQCVRTSRVHRQIRILVVAGCYPMLDSAGKQQHRTAKKLPACCRTKSNSTSAAAGGKIA